MTWSVTTPIKGALKEGKWIGDDANDVSGSNRLWGREWKILISNADDTETWDVTNLRCVFEVKKSRETRNYATISIYNLKKETEQAIILNGDRLVIEAGYGTTESAYNINDAATSGGVYKQYGKIFDGKILYPTRHRENNVDYVLTMLCGEGENLLGLNWVAQSLQRGLNQRQIAENVCALATTKVQTASISENLSPQKLARGKVLFGEPKDYLDALMRGNYATYWTDGEVVTIAKPVDVADGEALVVSPQTGLIGMPSQTQFGASWTLLLNPSVKIFGRCQLKNSDMTEYQATPGSTPWAPLEEDRIYQVYEITHKGDTWGNDWYTECQGLSRQGKTMVPTMMASPAVNPF